MKLFHLFFLVISPLLAAAWSPDDHEIFRLNDELGALEGSNATFYSFVGTSPSATTEEITKAYRSKSRTLHPDKAIPARVSKLNAQKVKEAGKKGKSSSKTVSAKERKQITKEVNERHQRLSLVATILRDHRRERYDYFLKNGFPIWRGTGYYYARFRPGLGMVLAGLALVFGGGMHYGAMYMGWKRHRDFVERYVTHARRPAWGDDTGIPGLSDALNGSATQATPTPPPELEQQDSNAALNRRQKRMQEKESKREKAKPTKNPRKSGISRPVESEPVGQNAVGARKKVRAENGKVLIVDAEGNVFLEEETKDGETHELLLDPDEIPMPSILDTALFRVPVWAYSKTVGRMLGAKSGANLNEQLLADNDLTVDNPSGHPDEVLENAASINPNAEARKRKSKAKARK